MAPQKAEVKNRRSRKARTEVEVSSSSEASSSSESEHKTQPQDITTNGGGNLQAPSTDDSDDEQAINGDDEQPRFTQRRADPNQAFEAFYLRQATKEFANDLEKLRAASDFRGERSVEVIVGALKQGTACFGKEELEKVGGAAAAA